MDNVLKNVVLATVVALIMPVLVFVAYHNKMQPQAVMDEPIPMITEEPLPEPELMAPEQPSPIPVPNPSTAIRRPSVTVQPPSVTIQPRTRVQPMPQPQPQPQRKGILRRSPLQPAQPDCSGGMCPAPGYGY